MIVMNRPLRFIYGGKEYLYDFYLKTPIGIEDLDNGTRLKHFSVTFRVSFDSNIIKYYTSKERDGQVRRREFSIQPRALSTYFHVPRRKPVCGIKVARKISPILDGLCFPSRLRDRVLESLMALIRSLDSVRTHSYIRPVEVAVEMIKFIKVVPPISSIFKNLSMTAAPDPPDFKKERWLSRSKSKDESRFSCPICLGFLMDETSTQCGHIFCRTCIRKAVTAQGKCPTCRKAVVKKDLIRVFLPAS